MYCFDLAIKKVELVKTYDDETYFLFRTSSSKWLENLWKIWAITWPNMPINCLKCPNHNEDVNQKHFLRNPTCQQRCSLEQWELCFRNELLFSPLSPILIRKWGNEDFPILISVFLCHFFRKFPPCAWSLRKSETLCTPQFRASFQSYWTFLSIEEILEDSYSPKLYTFTSITFIPLHIDSHQLQLTGRIQSNSGFWHKFLRKDYWKTISSLEARIDEQKVAPGISSIYSVSEL